MRNDLVKSYELICWDVPDYGQLQYILGLAWDYLITDGETTAPMTRDKIVNMTFNYGLKKNINQLIKDDFSFKRTQLKPINKKNPNAPREQKYSAFSDKDLLNLSIQEIFHVMKHWFEYKVPKWLSVMNEIQKFVCLEKGLRAGNYRIYANMIENDFLQDNLSILAEFGIPSSAIRKLEKLIPKEISEDAVLQYIKDRGLNHSKTLIAYEQIKLQDI